MKPFMFIHPQRRRLRKSVVRTMPVPIAALPEWSAAVGAYISEATR